MLGEFTERAFLNGKIDLAEDEISLKDIIDFFIESWKTILLTAILGLLGASAYVVTTPLTFGELKQEAD